jgi:hypothetical protein
VVLALLLAGGAAPALGQEPDPWTACRPAIEAAERGAGLPDRLLAAIARVETGRREPLSGRVVSWPWSVNAAGVGRFLPTRQEAVAHVAALRAQGIRSIDVGCLQINLMHHPQAFATLEEAFDPGANARYAARFLTELRARTGDWSRAVAHYHSATPERGADYQRRVLAVLGGEGGDRAGMMPLPGRPVAPQGSWVDRVVVLLSPAAASVRVLTPGRVATTPRPVEAQPVAPPVPASAGGRLPRVVVPGRG